MPRYYRRSEIGLRPARSRGIPLKWLVVKGVALHWPAMGKDRLRTVDEVMRALRGWQDYHQKTQGWSDIGYQLAVDQEGNSYELRGHGIRSGANGNLNLNLRFGAILLVLAEGEWPTAAMLATVRWEIKQHRKRYRRSTWIGGHGDIRPGGTQCPGPAVEQLLADGAFTPERRYNYKGVTLP